jgi:ribonuclease D
MSNWERRPLRKSQQHYGALDAYIMIDIIKFLIEKAKTDGLSPFSKFVKTLDNTKMILSNDYDSDDFDEQKAYGNKEEKIVVNRENIPQKNKKKQWKNKDPKEENK